MKLLINAEAQIIDSTNADFVITSEICKKTSGNTDVIVYGGLNNTNTQIIEVNEDDLPGAYIGKIFKGFDSSFKPIIEPDKRFIDPSQPTIEDLSSAVAELSTIILGGN